MAFWDNVKSTFQKIGNGIKSVATKVADNFPTVLSACVNGAANGGIVGAIGGAVSGIATVASNDTYSEVGSEAPSKNMVSQVVDTVVNAVNKGANVVKTATTGSATVNYAPTTGKKTLAVQYVQDTNFLKNLRG